ncbi:hypothetical protein GCM10023258_17960 [Terrabacter aeriphilus]|uniref:DUF4184 family protein n=1 Tax=Terrabacter aeriphilus TaxID=515662 RepID=A0ABP9J9Y7_9MICO
MPFTPSHAVVAIPLRRLGLPLAAAAVGAMAPDVAMFLPGLFAYRHTHSVTGVATTDLALGVVVVTTWWAVLRAPVIDVLPDAVRRNLRLDVPGWRSPRWWASVVAGVVVGSVTHVVWDAFTHAGRWGSELLPWLTTPVGPWPLTRWLQYLSGIGGLVGILAWWWAVQRRRRLEPAGAADRVTYRPSLAGRPGTTAAVPESARTTGARWLRTALRALPVAGGLCGLLLGVLTTGPDRAALVQVAPERLLVRAVVVGGLGVAVGLLALAGVWHVAVGPPRRRAVPAAEADG